MSTGRASAGPLSLRANFRWTFAGNVVNAACLWGVIALLARWAGPSAVGQFSLGNAIAAPVMAVAMFQLRALLVTDVRGEFPFSDYLGARLFWTVLGLVAIAAITVIWPLSAETVIIVLLVGVAKAADSLSDIVRGLFQRLERMNYSGGSLMIRGPAALAAMGLTLLWTESAVWATAALAAGWLLTFLLYDILVADRLLRDLKPAALGSRVKVRLGRAPILKLTWVALPLGVVMGVISLQTNIPRYVIQDCSGEAALGFFSALAYPMIAVTMVFNAMGQSAAPRLSTYFVEQVDAFGKLLTKLAGLAAILGVGFVGSVFIVGRPVLTLLYGPEYAEYQPSFVVLSLATAVQLVASCYGYGLTAARYVRVQVILVSISCIVTFLAAFMFVPESGVWGGAWAVVVTSVTMLVLFSTTTMWAIRRRRGELARTAGLAVADWPGRLAGESVAD